MAHCGPKKQRRRRKHKHHFGGDTHKTILLMGLPNVGKSAIFSRFTGLDAMVSNYSGTTVEFYEAPMTINNETYLLKDAPGIYNLQNPNDDAERVAMDMMKDRPEAIVFVLDAINFESSLHLLMQVLEYNIPTVVALNRTDLMKSRGMTIDRSLLQNRLNVSVIPTVALKGNSLDLVKYALSQTIDKEVQYTVPTENKDRWRTVEELNEEAVKTTPRKNGVDRFAFLAKPFPGIPIALLVLATMFAFVIGFGMGLRQFLLLPFFNSLVFPYIRQGVEALTASELLRAILIGEDYGFLIKGIEWPFALVLPYVISFYAMMSVLEDTGYLPRIAVLLDGVFKKIGLSGSSAIPLLLGYGCGIPAIMSTRSLPSRKQRLSVAVMVCFAVPCVSQTGAFIALLAERSVFAFLFIFFVSIFAMVIVGLIMDKINKQSVPFTLMELPPLLVPAPKLLSKKILFRVRHYLKEGAVPMVVAIFFAAILYELGFFPALGRALSPVVSGWLMLPEAASTPLVLGVFRRELAVLPLLDLDLTTVQFFTGALVALFYVPCIAMIATLAKEFNVKTALLVFIATTATALFIGGLFARGYDAIMMLFG